ncbi:MAG: hypothetical protein LBR53_12355 [Deltaproteobacteria bacterium]|jgi:hypothetical protein|nr:hypothetical protein [Deltaproteobacteria bacterium]
MVRVPPLGKKSGRSAGNNENAETERGSGNLFRVFQLFQIFRFSRINSLLLLPILLAACSIPARDPGQITETPSFSERALVLVFERERGYLPVSGARVEIKLRPPAALLSPADGRATTASDGSVRLSYRPVAVYDQPALNDGDVIADYLADFTVILETGGGETWEWNFRDDVSYARYQDPLYQGLNRDPDSGPRHVNLYLSD